MFLESFMPGEESERIAFLALPSRPVLHFDYG